jgi:hypothetical protein
MFLHVYIEACRRAATEAERREEAHRPSVNAIYVAIAALLTIRGDVNHGECLPGQPSHGGHDEADHASEDDERGDKRQTPDDRSPRR